MNYDRSRRTCTCRRAFARVCGCAFWRTHHAPPTPSVTTRRECRQISSVSDMATLRQDRRYGLSCAKLQKNTPNTTIYHVKLTDTAIRTLEAYQNIKVTLRHALAFAFCFCSCQSSSVGRRLNLQMAEVRSCPRCNVSFKRCLLNRNVSNRYLWGK